MTESCFLPRYVGSALRVAPSRLSFLCLGFLLGVDVVAVAVC